MTSPHVFAAELVREVDGITVVAVDTSKARYFGIAWRDLGSFGKRKFENLVAMSGAHGYSKILYV